MNTKNVQDFWKQATFIGSGIAILFWVGYNYKILQTDSTLIEIIKTRQDEVRSKLTIIEGRIEYDERIVKELKDKVDHLDQSDERFVYPSRIPSEKQK